MTEDKKQGAKEGLKKRGTEDMPVDNGVAQCACACLWFLGLCALRHGIQGSHFGLPSSEIHRMTGLPPEIV